MINYRLKVNIPFLSYSFYLIECSKQLSAMVDINILKKKSYFHSSFVTIYLLSGVLKYSLHLRVVQKNKKQHIFKTQINYNDTDFDFFPHISFQPDHLLRQDGSASGQHDGQPDCLLWPVPHTDPGRGRVEPGAEVQYVVSLCMYKLFFAFFCILIESLLNRLRHT